ncbi:hypothetical protein FKP32DRAFT_223764 [Trametes sanguinea]|nr:hypothetical protein FKP32DRAFT_223764 [Trametes sanguinea]
MDPQRNVLKAPRTPSYNLHIIFHSPLATMSPYPLEVYALLRDLSNNFPGDHTLFVRSEARAFSQSPDGHVWPSSAAPVAALMPNIVIKSHTLPSITLSNSLIPGQDVVDTAPSVSSPVVKRMIDIISLAEQGYRSALVLEEGSLLVWAANLKEGLRLFIDAQKALSAWYASFMLLATAYTNDVYPTSLEQSLDEYYTHSEPVLVLPPAVQWQNTTKLPSFAEYTLPSASEPLRPNDVPFPSPAVVYDPQGLSPLGVSGASDGPMLADFPADYTTAMDADVDAASLSCDQRATLPADYTVFHDLMPGLIDSPTSDDEAWDSDELATPYSIAHSQFPSPQIQDADLAAACDFWSTMPYDQLAGAPSDISKAVDKQPMEASSPPRLSPEPCTQGCSEVLDTLVHTIDEPCAVDSPKGKGKKRAAQQSGRSSKRRNTGSSARTVHTDVDDDTACASASLPKPRTAPAPPRPIQGSRRVLRSTTASIARTSTSPLTAPVASSSKAVPVQDDLNEGGSEDDDAEEGGEADDGCDDGEYRPGSQGRASSHSNRQTRSTKNQQAPSAPTKALTGTNPQYERTRCPWCEKPVSRLGDLPRHLVACRRCPAKFKPTGDRGRLYCLCHNKRFARCDATARHERNVETKRKAREAAAEMASRTRSGLKRQQALSSTTDDGLWM